MLSPPGAAEHAIAWCCLPRPRHSAPLALGSIPLASFLPSSRERQRAAAEIHLPRSAGTAEQEKQRRLVGPGRAKSALGSAALGSCTARPPAAAPLPAPHDPQLPSPLQKHALTSASSRQGSSRGQQVICQSGLRGDLSGIVSPHTPGLPTYKARPECCGAFDGLSWRVMEGMARAEVKPTPAATSVPEAAMASLSFAEGSCPPDRLGQSSANIGLAGTREQPGSHQKPSIGRLPFAPLPERKQTSERLPRPSGRPKETRSEASLANAAQTRLDPEPLQSSAQFSEHPGCAHATSDATHTWGGGVAGPSAAATGQASESTSQVGNVGPDREAAEGASFPEGLDPARLPRHVAMILDGNSRWAERRRLPKEMGHEAGVQALKRTVRLTGRWGISALTVFAFSTENWNRPKMEVDFLMTLLERLLDNDIAELHREGVVVQVMGDVAQLSPGLQRKIQSAWELTQHNPGLKLSIAVNYSGRQDIVHACRQLAASVAAGELAPDDICEEMVDASLGTGWLGPGLGSPDLLIRTSGEQRLSNFLLWQSAYTELVFCPCLWPDFNEEQYAEALQDYQRRDRRFGGRK